VAAAWYFLAYVIITFVAAAAQGFYKEPVYSFFMDTLDWGSTGETVADVTTMVINAAISFWVFFPIFKIIFKRVPEDELESGEASPAGAGQVTDASIVGHTADASSVGDEDATAATAASPDSGPEGR
ncbi:MAG: hypothetical protein ACK5MR_10275, partial [Cumulibacter sp.]